MPNRPVTIRRWEVVAAFVTVVALAAGSVQISLMYVNDRIDKAEKRITENAVENAAQDAVRRQLVFAFQEADMRACRQIEKLKAEFRLQADENFARLEQNAALLQIELTPELREQARLDYERTLKRFASAEC